MQQYYTKKKNLKESHSAYIIVFVLIYMTSSYFSTVAGIIPGIVSVVILFLASVLGVFINRRNFKENFNARGYLLLLLLIIVSLISSFIYGDGLYNHLIIIFAVLSGYLVTLAYSFERFVDIYLKLMYFLSVFSILVFLVVSIIPSIFVFTPVIGYRVGVEVHNLFFAVVLPGAEFNRNYGLFWEPGAFQVYLNLALIFELFAKNETRKRYVLGFIVAIITTFSTTGYIVLVPILLAFLIKSNFLIKYKSNFKYVILIAIISLLAIKFMPENYIRLLFGKLEGLFSESGNSNFSTTVRVNAIIYPFYEFIKSPFIGIGYSQYLKMAAEKIYTMPTFTPINWFALFGLLWGLPCNYYYIRNVLNFKTGNFSRFLIAIALFLVIISEDFIRIAFMYVLIFYGTKNMNQNKQVNTLVVGGGI
ncbi:putative LPS biosynthesis transmembrane protein [Paenibacillus sp. FSL R7-277]|uniref:hypothetical protein n=1 Tax=Paenibacillus sp. FSL R7-277 TaxID=1227352 RepID=UPI0003E1F59E|nr:hypothetical protein [Paenibacillus sp. FSL R7-277]ETT72288.1 putative LPS biosynthesis transmembrane protein [Paenibacillus sp. FSL R7-277]